MTPDDFAALEISRYELKLRAREPISLPPFLGSTLRGAFGHALKEAVCVMPHRNCQRCLVAERCIYPYVFETPAPSNLKLLRGQQLAPHPFILTPPILKATQRMAPAYSSLPQGNVKEQVLSDGRAVRLVQSAGVSSVDAPRDLRPGDELKFGLVLIGRAVEYMPFIIYAVSEMARRGLGVNRGRFDLVEASLVDSDGRSKTIYSGGSQRICLPGEAVTNLSNLIRARLDQLTSEQATEKKNINIRFLTPARIRVDGDLQADMSFDLLVRNLLRRISLLVALHGNSPLEIDYRKVIELASGVETRSSVLRWWDWERYSNRQETKMKMGGFIGEIEYGGEQIQKFLPLLIAGEILHVGAGTSFGLGKYRLAA